MSVILVVHVVVLVSKPTASRLLHEEVKLMSESLNEGEREDLVASLETNTAPLRLQLLLVRARRERFLV